MSHQTKAPACKDFFLPRPLVYFCHNFSYFPRLPTEIQLDIWTLVANQPRILPLDSDRWEFSSKGEYLVRDGYQESPTGYRYYARATVPGLLHANKQLRDIGLKHFKLAFESSFNTTNGVVVNFPARFYVNSSSYILLPFNMGGYEFNEFLDFVSSFSPGMTVAFPSKLTSCNEDRVQQLDATSLKNIKEVIIYRWGGFSQSIPSKKLELMRTGGVFFYHIKSPFWSRVSRRDSRVPSVF